MGRQQGREHARARRTQGGLDCNLASALARCRIHASPPAAGVQPGGTRRGWPHARRLPRPVYERAIVLELHPGGVCCGSCASRPGHLAARGRAAAPGRLSAWNARAHRMSGVVVSLCRCPGSWARPPVLPRISSLRLTRCGASRVAAAAAARPSKRLVRAPPAALSSLPCQRPTGPGGGPPHACCVSQRSRRSQRAPNTPSFGRRPGRVLRKPTTSRFSNEAPAGSAPLLPAFPALVIRGYTCSRCGNQTPAGFVTATLAGCTAITVATVAGG